MSEVMGSQQPPITDLIEYLVGASGRLLELDSGSGEGRAMRDAALRIKALLSMLSDEQDASVAARNECERLRYALRTIANPLLEADVDEMRREARKALGA